MASALWYAAALRRRPHDQWNINTSIELDDMPQNVGPTDDQKESERKKDLVTIADNQGSDGASASKSARGAGARTSKRTPPSAAVYAMDGPSIREVLSSPPGLGREHDFGHASVGFDEASYFDVCSITVPANKQAKTSEGANRSAATSRKSSVGVPKLDSPQQEDDVLEQQQQRSEENEDPVDNRQTRKVVISILIVFAIAGTWTGSTQFSKSSLSSGTFKAPYFLVWFNTNWMGVCFPFYVLLMAIVLACFRKKLSQAKSPYRVICDASLVFGPSGLTLKAILTRSVPFTFLWIVANYTYSQALLQISAVETTTVFSSNLAFVYLLSWIFLHDTFVALRILAVLLAIVGIVLMVNAESMIIAAEGYTGTRMTIVGVVCAIAAAAVSAIYKVSFKKIIGDANFGQVSLFMTMLGLCNLLLSWPIALALLLSKAETVKWDDVPWPYICGSAVLSLLFNLFVNVGIAYTHPVYISVGLFLGLPLNAVIDAIWRGVSLTPLKIIGGVCILVSFLILMLPEDFASSILRRLGLTRTNHRDVYIITRPELLARRR